MQLGVDFNKNSLPLTKEQYANGYTFMAHNFSDAGKSGTVKTKFVFTDALKEAVILIVFIEREKQLHISASGNVSVQP